MQRVGNARTQGNAMLEINRKPLTITQTHAKADAAKKPQSDDKCLAGRIAPNLIQVTRAKRRSFVDARREQNAIEHAIKLPQQEETLHLIIDGRFQPCDLIPAMRRLSDPATIENLYVMTLGLNEENTGTICRGIDAKKIKTATIITSHYFRGAERPLFNWTKTEIENRGGRVFGLRTHAKIMLMEMTDGQCYSIEGSGNLRSCKSVEQMQITNSRPLFEFHQAWIEDFIVSSNQK